MMSHPFHIVCIADEAYAQHAAVMLTSLFETNRENKFRVFLMTISMGEETKRKLYTVAEGYGNELSVIEVGEDVTLLEGLKTETIHKTWNPIMYLKLLIPQNLPQEVKEFLFLDVDVIVNHNIRTLYKYGQNGTSIVYACEDYKFQQVHKDRLGLRDEDLYINSGVMMVNLEVWRKMNQEVPMSIFLNQYKEILNNDQDAFALYFRGKIGLLPTNQWNATTFFFEQAPRILDKYLSELGNVRKDPYIVHFCEPVKPWFKECTHPYQYLYAKYLQHTPWRDYQFANSGAYRGWELFKYYAKYWLNVWGIREEPMALIKI